MPYPPEPWDLRGQLHLSLWRPPLSTLPALPSGVRPVLLGGRPLVGTAWVDYEPGGVLSYRELLCAVAVRQGARPRVSITDIWVDSPESRDGGRALWGIPKDLAEFEFGATLRARLAGALIAESTVVPRRRLPGRWPAAFSTAQALAGRLAVTPVRSTSAVELTRVDTTFAPDGPLGHLAGLRPVISLSLRDFRLRFGPRR
ncbi:acetoacetate decarboxylase family protein [Umezawaea beigongshangensis]|uniref:acetoacetate decarboxylase family protein n=1 Tax=Umezawaea beigongshangensis TaxID=2780383 RepID=UPI0018F20378|nr:acetoacetate decarboxylase family protein [Umezawaea beigongshangensis]